MLLFTILIIMNPISITFDEFLEAAKDFVRISNRICDGWTLYIDNEDLSRTFIKKQLFVTFTEDNVQTLAKAEYVIFFNLSYGVPSFSFNIWDSSGVLFTLEKIRQMSVVRINKEDFYSVISQQEHPIFFKPYFIMHPCHTSTLLHELKSGSKNIIVTFLGFIMPLLKLNLRVEYGL